MKKLIIVIFVLLTTSVIFAQTKYTPSRALEKQWYETYGINLFRNVEGTWFDLENDNNISGIESYFNVLDWLQGRVAGLQVYHYRNIKVPLLRNRPATVFVDEVRVDYAFLNALSTADIALIKIIQAPVGVVSAPGGAIAIYTKRGEGG